MAGCRKGLWETAGGSLAPPVGGLVDDFSIDCRTINVESGTNGAALEP